MADSDSNKHSGELEMEKQNSASYKPKTEKGKRMAASISEYILFRYFFPEVKDRKRMVRFHEEFLRDMNFSLKTGKVTAETN